MYKHLTEFGLVLQVLGVIPPLVNSLIPSRDVYDKEVGITVASKSVPGWRDRLTLLGGFVLVAAGAALQLLAVCLTP